MAAGSNNIVTDGLVGCWDAGNRVSYPTTGTTWTDLVNSNNATLENMVGESNSGFNPWHGGVFQYDGSDAYIDLGSITSSNPLMCAGGPVSMCLWVYDVSGVGSSAYPYIIVKGGGDGANGYGIIGDSEGRIQVVCDGTWSGTATGLFVQDKWQFISGTIDTSGNMRAYINGVYYTNDTLNNTAVPPDTTATMTFGKSNWFGGYLGPVYIYNTLLTDAEVKQNYEATKPRFTPRIAKSGMLANWDAGDPKSYNGGQTWTDTANGFVGPFYNGAGEAISFDSANGGSLVFDGTDDRIGPIILPGDYSGTARSILLWVSPDTHEQEMIAFNSADDKFKATVGQSTSYGKYIFRADVGESSPQTGSFADSLITVGDWVCIGMTINASDEIVSMYLNGVSKTGGSQGWNFQDDTYIGRSSSGAPWNGKIATVRLYTKTLSAAEVLDNYQYN